MEKMIVEARLYGLARDIVADGTACAEAGAAVVHFRCHTETGDESNNPDDLAAAITGLRARSDVLINAALGRFDRAAEERIAPLQQLAARGIRPDLAPVDMGTNNIDVHDSASGAVEPGFVYRNNTSALLFLTGELTALGIKPQLGLWSIPNARLTQAFLDSGQVAAPAYAAILLSNGPAGHPATPAGFQAHLDLALDERTRWTVRCQGPGIMPLLPDIVARGGHISIGLGDHDHAERGWPTNADLVRDVIAIARSLGREIATPREARSILGMN